jgi:4-hydroxythreonine-4-phosphate dehydrogenase
MTKPRIALFTGDPAGIGPELSARILADPASSAAADLLVITSRAVMAEAVSVTGRPFAFIGGEAHAARGRALDAPMLLDWPGADATGFERGVAGPRNGAWMLDGLRLALRLCSEGAADAIVFAPLNKAALRAGGMAHPDELHFFCEVLDFHGPCVEFNVLEGLWTSRVTSHVALKDVASLITAERVAQGVQLLYSGLQRSGLARPRVAVCGLNPHNGDGGAFGREEIEVIGPGVELARARGYRQAPWNARAPNRPKRPSAARTSTRRARRTRLRSRRSSRSRRRFSSRATAWRARLSVALAREWEPLPLPSRRRRSR